jgi:hypothetical protein
MSNNSRTKDFIINLFIIVSAIYFLFPLLQSGFVSDDAYNSLIRGNILEKNQTFINYVLDLNWGWIKGSGRLYPIEHFSQTFLFYFIKNVFSFKIFKLTIILISIYYFKKNLYTFFK